MFPVLKKQQQFRIFSWFLWLYRSPLFRRSYWRATGKSSVLFTQSWARFCRAFPTTLSSKMCLTSGLLVDVTLYSCQQWTILLFEFCDSITLIDWLVVLPRQGGAFNNDNESIQRRRLSRLRRSAARKVINPETKFYIDVMYCTWKALLGRLVVL